MEGRGAWCLADGCAEEGWASSQGCLWLLESGKGLKPFSPGASGRSPLAHTLTLSQRDLCQTSDLQTRRCECRVALRQAACCNL